MRSLFNNGMFNKEDFDKKVAVIAMTDVFNITVETVSPLLQMDKEGKQRKGYVYENDVTFSEPFYSANGLRGLLRRVATSQMIEIIRINEPDFKIKAEETHLYCAGAGSDKKSIELVDFTNVSQIRGLSPLLSCFGAGLSNISGKVAISDLTPNKNQTRFKNYEESSSMFSTLIGRVTYVRDDETSKNGIITNLMDMEDVIRWKEEHAKKVADSKDKVKLAKTSDTKSSGKDTKEETSNMQQVYELEYIIPGATLSSCINPINASSFTDIEKGMLLKALVDASLMQLGSAKRYNFGMLNWNITLEGEQMITTTRDKDFIGNVDIIISDRTKELISAYDKFALENYSSKKILIKEMIKSI